MRSLPWRRNALLHENTSLVVIGFHGSGFFAGSTSPGSTSRFRVRAVLSHHPRKFVRQKLMGADSSFRVGPNRPLGNNNKKRIGLGFESASHRNEFHPSFFKFTSSSLWELAIYATRSELIRILSRELLVVIGEEVCGLPQGKEGA